MRWFWIDRFLEFEHRRRAVAVKNISLAEDCMEEHLPGFPVFQNTLVIEGIAQTGGLLAGEASGFLERVVLAKVAKAVFHFQAVPGDTLTYAATLEDIKPDGAICVATSHCGSRLHAEVELVFAHLDDRFAGVDLFKPSDFLVMLRLLGMYTVGRKPDGSLLDIPAHLLEAEHALDALPIGAETT